MWVWLWVCMCCFRLCLLCVFGLHETNVGRAGWWADVGAFGRQGGGVGGRHRALTLRPTCWALPSCLIRFTNPGRKLLTLPLSGRA